jgi:type II secretory pathway pseudopilin PulG
VLIIGVLLGIALPVYQSSVRNASATVVRANLNMIARVSTAYFMKNGQYPSAIGDIVGPGKDIEGLAGPRGVTYDVGMVDSSGGSGGSSGNSSGNGNGKGQGTGAPGNGKGQGGNKGNKGGSGSGSGSTTTSTTFTVTATENGTDAFGSSATDDTATMTLPDGQFSGL